MMVDEERSRTLVFNYLGVFDGGGEEAGPWSALAEESEDGTAAFPSPTHLFQADAVLWRMPRGERPAVRVEGDVQLAADVNWLVDHLRWDIEEDLSRVIGDAPAHALARAARDAAQALQQFVRGRPRPPADKAPA